MPHGLRGTLLSHAYVQSGLASEFAGRLGEPTRNTGRTGVRRLWRRIDAALGPASGVRTILDIAAVPLFSLLGFGVHDIRQRERGFCAARLEAFGQLAAWLLVTPWGESLETVRREAIRSATDHSARWSIVMDGRFVRLIDPHRSFARRYLEFDLSQTIEDEASFEAFWGTLRAEALSAASSGRSPLAEILTASERHAVGVCQSLREGVLEALVALLNGAVDRHRQRRRQRHAETAFVSTLHEQCLTIVYRILFLLFAEARTLVPLWHPLFRAGYSIEAIRALAEDPMRPPGLWDALQAICRLAHHGCHAGDLVVTPFNGRLFAPERTAAADRIGVADDVVREAIVSLSSRPEGRSGRRRVSYGELGVEELGAVYESVLDYQPTIEETPAIPAARPRLVLRTGSGRRKATGSFYTPRSITEFLVRRTLHPLVSGRTADDILNLRVLDPAMGSGAFLVASCRYLSSAYETALIREGRACSPELDIHLRAAIRRLVAQRCLYGVDINPMAVQLACLSLWLATLAADRPLTFLDHHMQVGDSLVGASFDDLSRQPSGASHRSVRPARLPLFEAPEVESVLRDTLPHRLHLALHPDDTVAAVRAKELMLASLGAPDAGLSRCKRIADLWCAGWFWASGSAPPPAALGEIASMLLHGRSALPREMTTAWLREAGRIAADHRFFHWSFEFPEIFFDSDGRARADGGFDAVVGNPPWDMLRAADAASSGRTRALMRFVRCAGIYRDRTEGHANLYHLFLERALNLLKPGGRLGLVLPAGLATDHGARLLRRRLLEACDTDSIVGFDNRAGIFPIHRGLRFLLLTSTAGRPTTEIRCRFGESAPSVLDRIPDQPVQSDDMFPVMLTRRFIEDFSNDHHVIPDLRSPLDLQIVEKILSTIPALGDDGGWRARFGRELNATEDRRHFSGRREDLPVLEGKHLRPFAADVAGVTSWIPRRIAARILDPRRTFLRERVAYRDVASPTNQLTLIATIVPPNVMTTHTIFCLTTRLDPAALRFLCGVFNSYVANYLVRLRVTTHVTTAIVRQLRVPVVGPRDAGFIRVVRLTNRLLAARGADLPAYIELQAVVSRLYGLTGGELSHVLQSFPLVAADTRQAVMKAFEALDAVA